MRNSKTFLMATVFFLKIFAMNAVAQPLYHEQYRPQIHFSPKEKWTNDPNGMVYYKGTYHLFFQYHPYSTKWGPMHWGHAISHDLIHWKEQPIALYPDSLGYIFSGSAVVDKKNTSGFGDHQHVPMIAIYTSHNAAREKEPDHENQSIAYSLDDGNTWIKYDHNPVLKNPGISDFRDPKVMWYEPQKKWIMTLATRDRVTFYSSPDLKEWTKESEFGRDEGAHGGVWECPDLFALNDHNGKKIWVLIVNLNPGGPNKGSATQYFVGDFNGHLYTSFSKQPKWIDYGPDDYAGITWSNTGDRKIFLGWMSNWMYANEVPSEKWRNAMTIPRELKIKHVGREIFVASGPVREISGIQSTSFIDSNIKVNQSFDLTKKTGTIKLPCRIKLNMEEAKNFSIHLSNHINEKLVIGFDRESNQYFIDRTSSGKVDFNNEFAAKHVAPRISSDTKMTIDIIIDESSVELFADDGLTTMTEVFFPAKPYDNISLDADNVLLSKLEYIRLSGIWP